MGSVKIDLYKRQVMYDQAFNLETQEGVLRFLKCYHELQARRNEGDLEAATLIMDFMRVWDEYKHRDEPLTLREKQIIHYVYGLGLSKSEAAERLGITIQALRKHEKKAARKLAMLIGGCYERGITESADKRTSRAEAEAGSRSQERTSEQPD